MLPQSPLVALIASTLLIFLGAPAIAQITPDASLGAEQSTVAPPGIINGGATRGANLFHSFSNFNVPNGGSIYFANPAGIERIFSRVTGTTRSNILGTLGVLGNADLFLLNPNGIVFGPNARLDVRGSFIASTANSLVFDNGVAFSATNPQAPPLLTVNVPIGLQYGSNPPGRIVSQGFLVVNPGRSLVLAGGDINLNNTLMGVRLGQGGRVELAAVSGEGTVGLSLNSNLWNLNVPDGLARGDLAITNGSLVQTVSRNGGSITVHARNVDLSGDSRVATGIGPGGTANSQAGNITLNATGSVRIDGTEIANSVFNGVGQAGDINITARSLSLTNGASIQTQIASLARGQAGNINLNTAETIRVDGSYLSNVVDVDAVGKAGNINITTRSLFLTNGAEVGTTIFGQGQAGNLVIHASDLVLLESTPSSSPSGLFNTVALGAVGNGGETLITTGTLLINNGGRINSSTFGRGNAGRINIIAQDAVALDGIGGNREFSSAVVSQVATPGIGNGGDIEITAKTFSLTNGAQLAASAFGRGNAGNVQVTVQDSVTIDGVGRNGVFSGIFSSLEKPAIGRGGDIEIQAGSLFIADGAGLFASTVGRGDSGQIRVQTTGDIEIASRGRVLATVEPGAVGNAQGIVLEGRSLSVSGGSQISTNTFGQGNAGILQINTTDAIKLTGQGSVISSRSGGTSFNTRNPVNNQGEIGQGGDIQIITNQLQISDRARLDAQTQTRSQGGTISVNVNTMSVNSGGQIRTTTLDSGQAGDITLNVNDHLALAGSDTGLFANTDFGSTGKGGTISVDSRSMTIRDRARISANSQGTGEGGQIDIQTNSLRLANQASISADTFSNIGGNIQIDVRDVLLLRQNSSISTNAGTGRSSTAIGKGGDIAINAGFIVAVPFENSDITANAFLGSGGNISIQTQGIFGIAFRPALTPFSDITASSEFGLAGSVAITTLGIDPVQGTVNLPTTFSQPPLAQGCRTSSQTGSFKNIGQGGIASNPVDPMVADAIWQDLAPSPPSQSARPSSPGNAENAAPSAPSAIAPIVEAQGWVVLPNGTIVLTAEAPTALPHGIGNSAIECLHN
jgi:filamentous hemagglutinin family protein